MTRFKFSYIPQLGSPPVFEREFDSLRTMIDCADVVFAFSLFEYENNIKPDYADVAYFEALVGDNWISIEEYDEIFDLDLDDRDRNILGWL